MGVQLAPSEGAIFTRTDMPDDTAVSCAKMAEPIEIPFGLWTWVGPRKHMLHGVHIGAIWRIREPSICGGDAAFLSNYLDHLFTVLQSYCTKKLTVLKRVVII